jgi:hypothetical protein
MYDFMLKSYSLPTYIIIQVIDENDNLPYEPFLSNPFDLTIEQTIGKSTIIYEFKPIDLDDGLNSMMSIDCVNCSVLSYFHLIRNTTTNSSMLITRSNMTVPNGIYTLAFILRDHGLIISRERFYTLTFHLTQRMNHIQDSSTLPANDNRSIVVKSKQKDFIPKLFIEKFQWYLLFVLLISWLILVIVAIWTCYHYERMSKEKSTNNEQQRQQFEIQVRKHEIIGQTMATLPVSASFPNRSHKFNEKETLTQDDDEIEDTSYDADHIMTDANFVLTSGCTTNDSNVRYVSSM